jgi:hypothetical protein
VFGDYLSTYVKQLRWPTAAKESLGNRQDKISKASKYATSAGRKDALVCKLLAE